MCEVCNLLSKRGRSCCLPVRPAHHWHICILVSHLSKGGLKLAELRENYLFEGVLEHDGVCKVIDVLAGARKVQVFFEIANSWVSVKALLEEVFDRLYVVVGNFLDLFYTLCVLQVELVKYSVEPSVLPLNNLICLGVRTDDFLVKEAFEPLKFDIDAEADEGKLRVVGSQWVARTRVSAVNWTDCC